MLFEINENKLKQAKFLSLNDLGKIEKDLESILSINMFDTLFEDNPLLTIFQERPRQPEPDIVALDQEGNTVIFELKRTIAHDDAL